MSVSTLRDVQCPAIRALFFLLAAAITLTSFAQSGMPRQKAGSQMMQATSSQADEPLIDHLIITLDATRGAKLNDQLVNKEAGRLNRMSHVRVAVERQISLRSHLLKLEPALTPADARALAATLRKSAEIESVEPDQMMQLQSMTPNDPAYLQNPGQWHYMMPAGLNLGGADLPAAWDMTLGSGTIDVAVIDTGYRPHADLQAMLPGYDFIANTMVANDGDGRDADASDPGDYVNAGQCSPGASASHSTWHGTHVMGTVAALMNNGLFGTGVAPHVRILPVRVLGRCGGYTSDIVDGIRWAAGIDVPGAPHNANPARVINLSLGSFGACSAAFQSAVNDANARGAIVVVATGNGGYDSVSQPANCSGVIAVTAHSFSGDSADYANIGSQTTLSAPGGGCGTLSSMCVPDQTLDGPAIYSLGNTGLTQPLQDTYALKRGTSMAAPHVSGTIALMLSLNPALTRAEVISLLRSSARPFPVSSACAMTANNGLCGAGLLDARAALMAIAPAVQLTLQNQVVAPAANVLLTGSAIAPAGRSLVSYEWHAASSNPYPVALQNAHTLNASFIAPASGTYSFTLSVTDSAGVVGSANASVRVNSLPLLLPPPAQRVNLGATLRLQLKASDADGDALVFHAASLPPDANLSASGLLLWTRAVPAGDQSITWYASDADGSSAPGQILITVTDTLAVSTAAPAGSGGGGSMQGDLLLIIGALLAIGKRLFQA